MARHDREDRSRINPEVTAATSDHIAGGSGMSSSGGAGSGTGSGGHGAHGFNPGDLIGGRYRIVSILGKGGMGEVYRADDLTLGASVALKFLPPELAADPVRLDRFRSEVRVTRQISHTNVCRVYDIVEADGRVFLTMEYIDGEDLGSLLRRIGRLPQDKGVEIARQICAGLQAAHDLGVVHRDLKPANVMIDGRGRARIMDFGIASIGDVRGESAVAGTPVYMAPEQLAGREATRSSDIYALGLVLHEIFSGRRAHDAETLAQLREMHRTSTARTSLSRSVADIDPAIERAVERCLESDPSDRPASAMVVAASLPGGDPLAAALAAGETPSPEMVAAAGSRGGLRPWAAAMLLGIFAIAVGALVWMNPRTDLIAAVNPELPRVVLEQRAKEILRDLGGATQTAPPWQATGWSEVGGYLEWWKRRTHGPNRWDGIDATWGGPILFWYRSADEVLTQLGATYVVDADNPPRASAGQRIVFLDALGHLTGLEIRTDSKKRTITDSPQPPDEAQIARVLEFAGIDASMMTPMTPGEPCESPERSGTGDPDDSEAGEPAKVGALRPVVEMELDSYRSWCAPMPGVDDAKIGVHMGFRDGAVRWFRIEYPYQVDSALADVNVRMPEGLQWVLTGLIWLLMGGGAVVAWKNVRARRSDVRAAVRVAIAIFVVWTAGSVLLPARLPGVDRVFFGETPLIGTGIINAAYFLVFYIALEPTVRKVWPSVLVSWIRLTSGRWRDAMVGRDVLIGIAGGAILLALSRLAMVSPVWFAESPVQPLWARPWPIHGPAQVIGFALWSIPLGVITASVFTLVLALLRVVLRLRILAVVGLWLIFGLTSGLAMGAALLDLQAPKLTAGMVIAGTLSALAMTVQIALLLRYGFLSLAVAALVGIVTALVPIGPDSAAWWASSAAVPALIVGALGVYGYLVATGERSPTVRRTAG